VNEVAVIAHTGKTLDGGLDELRQVLGDQGVKPGWYEVAKSRKAPKQVRRAVADGAKLLILWGGDGMVQRCADALGRSDAVLAIIPAGTANLLASNLGVPHTIPDAVAVALHGDRRTIDVGTINGERFAVMAGAGIDAQMIRDADAGLKDRIGRLAYVWTGSKNLREPAFAARIDVDGEPWFKGKASCVLVGNVGKMFAGLEPFEGARTDDGKLELGVVTAEGITQWMRTIARATLGTTSKSPFVEVTEGGTIDVRLGRKVRFEVDGGTRAKVRRLVIKVERSAVTFAVPRQPR
jgi:diacylglycerol kinase family enzyme